MSLPDAELITLSEAAAFARKAKLTISRWVRDGSFPPPAVAHGHTRLWKAEDLRAWAEGRWKPPEPPSMKAVQAQTKTEALPEDLLTPAQAAQLLGVRVSWLKEQRLKKAGPPYVALSPARIRYMRSDLLAFCATMKVNPD